MPKEAASLLETAKRRTEVLRLRREGYTYREIASALEDEWGKDRLPNSWGPRHANKDVQRLLEKQREQLSEGVEALVEMEVQRLDEMLKGVFPAAKTGDPKAISKVLDIMERRAELLGLDEAEEYLIESGGEGFAFQWADPADAPDTPEGAEECEEEDDTEDT